MMCFMNSGSSSSLRLCCSQLQPSFSACVSFSTQRCWASALTFFSRFIFSISFLFSLHMQTVRQGACASAAVETTGVVPRILCSQRAEMEGGARLWEGVVIFEPGDNQLVERAAYVAVQCDILALWHHCIITGAVNCHCRLIWDTVTCWTLVRAPNHLKLFTDVVNLFLFCFCFLCSTTSTVTAAALMEPRTMTFSVLRNSFSSKYCCSSREKSDV